THVPKLPVTSPVFLDFSRALSIVLPPASGTVPLGLWFIVETHIRETEPLDGAFVVAADHLSLEALAGVDGEVCGGRLPLHLGHGALLLLGGLSFLLLGRAPGDVVVVAVAGRVLAVLVVALPPRTLCCWAFPPARPPRPWACPGGPCRCRPPRHPATAAPGTAPRGCPPAACGSPPAPPSGSRSGSSGRPAPSCGSGSAGRRMAPAASARSSCRRGPSRSTRPGPSGSPPAKSPRLEPR
uniref:Uncharacterized protein n=1 Tax=Macaca fascicularis TaxID=9541 RepID=A0A7N9IEI4_MACFA